MLYVIHLNLIQSLIWEKLYSILYISYIFKWGFEGTS